MLGETSLVPRLLRLLPVLPIGRMVDPDIKRMSSARAMEPVPCDLWDVSEAGTTGTPWTRSHALIDRTSLLRLTA